MVKVNNSDKGFTMPLTRGTLPVMSWFEYHGQLYLAFEWQVDDSKAPSKAPVVTLRAVCFDTTYGAIESLFAESADFKVRIVYDRDVSIEYTTANLAK
jgi:hypothetical protein